MSNAPPTMFPMKVSGIPRKNRGEINNELSGLLDRANLKTQ